LTTLIVAVLGGPALADAVNVTLPLPLPLAPLVIVSHEASLVAVQVQLAALVVTVIDPALPPTAAIWLAGATLYAHEAPAF
jgi:hypothetical protein